MQDAKQKVYREVLRRVLLEVQDSQQVYEYRLGILARFLGVSVETLDNDTDFSKETVTSLLATYTNEEL